MRHRVFTYITRETDLLVFEHVDFRHLLPQIPGGTVEAGEAPEDAALREAYEETGLKGLSLKGSLGNSIEDLACIGKDEKIHAWFFHLTTTESTSARWRHFEEQASDGSGAIEFELYWVPLDNIPKLGGIDGLRLDALVASIR